MGLVYDASASGQRLEVTATRRHFRLLIPEVCTHLECPRQEELSSDSRDRYALPGIPIRALVPPLAAKVSARPNFDLSPGKLGPSSAVVKTFVDDRVPGTHCHPEAGGAPEARSAAKDP